MNRIDHILFVIRRKSDFTIAYPTVSWLHKQLNFKVTILIPQSIFNLSDYNEDHFRKWIHSLNSLKVLQYENLVSGVIHSNLDKQKTLCIVTASSQNQKPSAPLDSETIELIELSPFPILLFPKAHSPKPPWRSILVPMSGEIRGNRALELAIIFGNKCRCPINIVHVIESLELHKNERPVIEKVSDAAHHELPEILNDFISAATPFSNMQEKRIIRRFSIVRGKADEQIMRELKKRKADMIAVQWLGNFMKGRAETLKAMLEQLQSPILLLKPDESMASRLKAGHQLAS